MPELEAKVELLKKELHDQRKIHDRLDIAIEKLTDVSNSIHRMLAVHDEKITRQEDAIVAAGAVAVLFFAVPLTKVVLWGALAWGVWSMMKNT